MTEPRTWWEAALCWPDEIKTNSPWRTRTWVGNLRQRQLSLWTDRELMEALPGRVLAPKYRR
jgi:hypothetical protein